MTRRSVGWRKEPARHALAAKGVRTVPREQLNKMPRPSVVALPKRPPTTEALKRIEKRIVEIDRGITEYGEDPIMFTYVRLDHEIEDLEKELSTYGGRAADDLREKVKGLRSDLQESETPWTDD